MLEGDFVFIATQPIEEERLSMGWNSDRADYIIYAYRDKTEEQKAHEAVNDADVVIIGSAPDSYILPRLKTKKLTFKYAERFYKTGLTLRNLPHAAAGAWLHHGRFQRYPLYMLCASAYTPADAAIFHNYIGRTYKWGYFPEVKRYDVAELMEKKQSAASVGVEHSPDFHPVGRQADRMEAPGSGCSAGGVPEGKRILFPYEHDRQRGNGDAAS